MTGNRRTPGDFPPSDNLRPAASLKDSGFWWGAKPGHMARMVKDVLKEAAGVDAENWQVGALHSRAGGKPEMARAAERQAYRDYWTRVREEMRLIMADLERAGTLLWER